MQKARKKIKRGQAKEIKMHMQGDRRQLKKRGQRLTENLELAGARQGGRVKWRLQSDRRQTRPEAFVVGGGTEKGAKKGGHQDSL